MTGATGAKGVMQMAGRQHEGRGATSAPAGEGAARTEAIQVVIVDDHPLFRQGVAHTLAGEPDFDVVGEGATAADALRLTRDLLPDVLLLDITLPGGGLQAAAAIAAAYPVTKIVMLTASEHEDDVAAALQAGARGYIVKGVSARELVSIVRAVAAGEGYVSPALAASLLAHLTRAERDERRAAPAGSPLDELTEREREILERVAAGASNKEIGQQLHLTEKTVKHYMTNILQKLQVRNRVEAALLAQRSARLSPT